MTEFNRALNRKHNFDSGDGAKTEQQFSRKRKKPTELSSRDTASHQNYLLVYGDDPKPRPRMTEQEPMYKSANTIYNHYASGQRWWDGDKEGINSDEIGYSEVWECLGSTKLGKILFPSYFVHENDEVLASSGRE